jgi:hypothetical protein
MNDLGQPWTKHKCYYPEKEPARPKFFDSIPRNGCDLKVGIIRHSTWIPRRNGNSPNILLAIDAGEGTRTCLSTRGTNSADYFLGQLAVVDYESGVFYTSDHSERDILQAEVSPNQLGLSPKWLTNGD